MAFGIDLDKIIASLGTNPTVAKAMQEFTEARNAAVQTVIHFNDRFDQQDKKLDTIIELLTKLSGEKDGVAVAGDHNILDVLEGQNVGQCDVSDCVIQTIHDHGNGPVVRTASILATIES